MPRKRNEPSTSAAAAAMDKAKRTTRRIRDSSSDDDGDLAAGPSQYNSTTAGANQKAKHSRRRVRSSSSDDDDFTPGPSVTCRPSQFNTTTAAGADQGTLINNLVKYFLNFSATKYPIKRPDVCKAVNIPPKQFAEIMKECVDILKDVYGLEVADVSETKNSSVFIVHADKNYAISAAQYPPEQRGEITLLFIILSYIFMKNGDVQDTHLIQFLEQINISVEEPHTVFGDVGKLIKEKFPRQLYLKRNKVSIEGVNETQTHVSWGVRAEKEFDKKEMLASVAKIMNRSPVTFINQYHQATQADAENEEEPMVLD